MTDVDDPALELARELIRKPSVTPDDHGCQQIVEDLLKGWGFRTESMRFGEVDNLWARRGDTEPVLCFAGHTDVVPPGPLDAWHVDPFAAEIHDGRLIARGAADMKSGLAAMVSACGRFIKTHPGHTGSIAFLITSDEEGEAKDGTYRVMDALSHRNERIDWCVIGEPSSAQALGDTVRIGRRGSLTGLMTLRGVQGHVAYPSQARNPIHDLADLVSAINHEPLDEGNSHFPPTSFQMVNVHSDAGAPNVIPGELQCRFNFRYSTQWTQETLAAHVEGLVSKLGIDCDITWRNAGDPFLTEEGRLSQAVSRAVKEHTGLQPELSTSGGTSDGRFIAPHGVDVVEFGPINKTIHKVNEEIRIEDIPRLTDIYYRIAELLLI
jgi:succinyl-diaminopimelate desuccinylase